MKYVVGLLMLVSFSVPSFAKGKKAERDLSTAPVMDDPGYERLPAAEKSKVDELEKVLQSTYEYNASMKELGDPGTQ